MRWFRHDQGPFSAHRYLGFQGELSQAILAHRASSIVGERWEDAKELARQSSELEQTFLASLLFARACLQLGEHAEAQAALEALPFSKLPPHNQVDHSLALAEVACITEDVSLYATARERLLSNKVETPYFRECVARLAERLSDQERDALRKQIEELKNSRDNRPFDPLRLSDSDIRAVIRHHRFLPPQHQAITLPLGLELRDMLGTLLTNLCSVLLDQRALLTDKMRSEEDTYTAFLAIQLQAAVAYLGWHTKSQDYGGAPKEGKAEFGRRDITIRKDGGAPFAIVEAVRARSITSTTAGDLREHVRRLMGRYDASRTAVLFTLVFVECTDLAEFLPWYFDCFSEAAFESTPNSTVDEGGSAPLVVLRAQHPDEGTRRTVNHLILKITPKA